MPPVFRAGLFCTVLVMGGVRLLKSLRGARRLPSVPRRAGGPGSPHGVGRERWLHLAMVWCVVLFCGSILVALTVPDRMARLSTVLDSALGGGAPAPEIRRKPAPPAPATIPPPGPALVASATSAAPTAPAERLASARRARRNEMRVGIAMVLSCAGAAVAAGIAAGVARTRRRPGLMTAATLAGLVASGAGFALSGAAASRLSGALQARRAIEEYSRPRTTPADGPGELGGPVRLVGRPEARAPGGPYLFLDRPASGEGETPVPTVEPFGVAGIIVPGAATDVLRVARPRVRLGPRGRERFIRADEDVMVLGFAVAGSIVPGPAYPAVVAPGDAPRVLERISADLLGTAGPRALYVALLQVLFAAGLGWSMAILLASGTEFILCRRGDRRGRAAGLRPATSA